MDTIGILKINEQAEQIPHCIRFDKGSGKFPFPQEFNPSIDAVKKEVQNKYFHYPHTGGEIVLKDQIIKLEKLLGKTIAADNIAVTHGGMSGLYTFFYLYFDKGDEIITSQYCFEGFSTLISHFGLKQKRVDYSNILRVEEAITKKTKAIIFNSPENPTGKVYTQSEIDKLVNLCQKYNLYFVSDEVMNFVIYEPFTYASPSLEYKKTVIVNSFSKTFFVPGIRIGWLTSNNKEVIQNCSDYLSVQSLGVNLFGQLLLAHFLQHTNYKVFLNDRLSTLTTRKNLVKKLLAKSHLTYHQEVMGGMNYYIDLQADVTKILPELLRQGVAVIPGELFEGKPSTKARMGFGAVSETEIEKGIQTIIKTV